MFHATLNGLTIADLESVFGKTAGAAVSTSQWGTCSADTLNGTVPEVTSNSVLSFEWVCQQTVNSGSSMRVDRI